MMDYTARYGLEFNPFLKNAKDILLDTAESSETKLRLDYLSSTKGHRPPSRTPPFGPTGKDFLQ